MLTRLNTVDHSFPIFLFALRLCLEVYMKFLCKSNTCAGHKLSLNILILIFFLLTELQNSVLKYYRGIKYSGMKSLCSYLPSTFWSVHLVLNTFKIYTLNLSQHPNFYFRLKSILPKSTKLYPYCTCYHRGYIYVSSPFSGASNFFLGKYEYWKRVQQPLEPTK